MRNEGRLDIQVVEIAVLLHLKVVSGMLPTQYKMREMLPQKKPSKTSHESS